MTPKLYVAPAASGKTAHLIEAARAYASDPANAPRVIVPTRLQARAWQTRLAQVGGALGVHVGTFDDAYRDILRQAGTVVTLLADPVQVRLLRSLAEALPLPYYDTIREKPGFIQALRDMIGELKAGGIFPEAFITAITKLDAPPRLMELAHLYEAYQLRLQQEHWADYAGVGWLAAEALEQQPQLVTDWRCVMVDGFDDLTTVQTRVLTLLAQRVPQLIVTLTGNDAPARPLVHKRFIRTRARLEKALNVKAQPLPRTERELMTAPAIRHLEQALYTGPQAPHKTAGAVSMVAVPDREAEVRTALRWVKSCIVHQGMRPGEVALLARDLTPYHAFIDQVAAEYGMPVRIAMGHALNSNPAIAALLELLHLAAPGDGYLAWRPTIAAWRSPYFDWAANDVTADDDTASAGITPEAAAALGWVARWGSVIGGEHWEEAFQLLSEAQTREENHNEEVPAASEGTPVNIEADALWQTFNCFRRRIVPPEGEHSYHDFVVWLEALIGDVEPLEEELSQASLRIAQQAASGPRRPADRDLAALNALKDVLRGLIWAESAVGAPPITYTAFLDELSAAVAAATYRVPLPADTEGILAADIMQARGVAFRAVAILGLAEGEFPATLSEDPFLRHADRVRLRDQFELPIDGSPESMEAQIFYEAVTRPRDRLLLTRPRIADNGTPWQASPFWEEALERLDITPIITAQSLVPTPAAAASWPELMTAIAARPDDAAAWDWIAARQPALCRRIMRGTQILAARTSEAGEAFDGDLSAWHTTFATAFAPRRTWSSSRLEAYRQCPFFFLINHVLGLAPRPLPGEGLDARQLGNIYHQILEELYRRAGREADLSTLLATIPEVANPILDTAPREQQFRATAWWVQTRRRILDNIEQSVEALENLHDPLNAAFTFYAAEHTFGIAKQDGGPLIIKDDSNDSFQVRGLIDRVDRDAAGRVRVIDYKTGGPSSYTPAALRKGEKLQLPLYALAAQQTLQLGEVVEGFYWHVRHAEASSLKLSRFSGEGGAGPQGAIETAVMMAWEAVHGARRGAFTPRPPDHGCPNYCPATAFCWHYKAASW